MSHLSANSTLNIPAWHWAPWTAGLILLAIAELVIVRAARRHTSGMLFHVLWTVAWIVVGVALGGVVWLLYGSTAGGQYYTSYMLANMLSIDNLAVLSAILAFFGIAGSDRHRPVYWGITGAIILRAVLLLVGVDFATHIQILMLVLGGWLGYAAVNLVREKEVDVDSSFVIKLLRQRGLVSTRRSGDKFVVRDPDGRLVVTILFVAVIAIEAADVALGFDSLAATVAVTQTALIAFVSNVAAVFGLRALFFVFEALQQRLWALKYGVSVALVGVAVETICSPARLSPFHIPWLGLEMPNWATMAYVLGVFGVAAGLSFMLPNPSEREVAAVPQQR